MSQSNNDRVDKALRIMHRALRPFIEGEMRAKYGDAWESEVRAAIFPNPTYKGGQNKLNLNDPAVPLKVIRYRWGLVFKDKLGQNKFNLVLELLEVRNSVKHEEPFDLENTYRALDSMQRLLSAIAAPEVEQIKQQKEEVRARQMEEGARKDVENHPPTAETLREPHANKPLKVVEPDRNPYLHFQPAALLTSKFIRQLDNEVLKRMPERLGWALVDACSRTPSIVWVHSRPYLNDQSMMPGISEAHRQPSQHPQPQGYKEMLPETYRLIYAGETFPVLSTGCRYLAIFIVEGNQKISDEVYAFIGQLQKKQLPYFLIQVTDNSGKATIYEEGNSVSLHSHTSPLGARPLSLTLVGNDQESVEEFLPFEMAVKGSASSVGLDIRLSDAHSFARSSYHFVIRNYDNQPLGNVRLRVNAALQADKPDDIVLEILDSDHRLWVQDWDASAISQRRSVFRGTITLHLIFDRTTIDDAAWSSVFDVLSVGRIDEGIVGTDGSTTRSWNQDLRNALAEALGEKVNELHEKVRLCLWWFADIPRDQMAPSDDLPWINQSYGPAGECLIEDLPSELSDRKFDYVSGFDLFDATDEVLERVASVIEGEIQRTHQQYAILIVGDSPPPPSGLDDVLWQHLVDKPVRTNARCSPHFTEALKTLNRLAVPVGWLFIHSKKSPGRGTSYSDKVKQFHSLSTFKEEVLLALQKIEGISIEGCAGLADIRRGLSNVFSRMAHNQSAIPGLQIIKVISGGRKLYA